MAAIFKSFAVEGLSSNSGSPSIVVSNVAIPALSYGVVIGLNCTNKTGSNQSVYVKLNKASSGPSAFLAYNLSLTPGTGYEFYNGNKTVLEPGDTITAYASNVTAVDLTLSVMIYT